MRVHELLEGTTENIDVLKKMGFAVRSELPDHIPAGQTIRVKLDKSDTFYNTVKTYQSLHPELYQKYKGAFAKLRTTSFVIINNKEYYDPYKGKNVTTGFGYYSSSDNTVVVFAYRLKDMQDETGTVYVKNVFFSMLDSIIQHEIRHLFQDAQYGEYSMSMKAQSRPYAAQSIEIDATWHQLVSSILPTPNDTAKSYTRRITSELNKYKDLTDKEAEHYYRKTMRYFAEYADHQWGIKQNVRK